MAAEAPDHLLHWPAKKMARHLAAVSFQYDKQLLKKGKDPDKMRASFYKMFTRKFPMSETFIPTEFDSQIVFDLDNEYIKMHGCGSCGTEFKEMLVIGKADVYYSAIARGSKNYYSTMDLYDDDPFEDWELVEKKEADFTEIALNYGLVVKDVCEKWDYESVMAQLLA